MRCDYSTLSEVSTIGDEWDDTELISDLVEAMAEAINEVAEEHGDPVIDEKILGTAYTVLIAENAMNWMNDQ